MGIDISVVMTLHSEGLIVHRTFKALQSNIELARKQGLTVENCRADDNYALRWACDRGHLEIVKLFV